jgi:hypothetical protein
MTPQVKDAIEQWLGTLIIGFAPLGAHAFSAGHIDLNLRWGVDPHWVAEIIIIAMTTSGLTFVSFLIKALKRSSRAPTMGSVFLMVALAVACLIWSAAYYGHLASSEAPEPNLLKAGVLLLWAIAVSIYLEVAAVAVGAPLTRTG